MIIYCMGTILAVQITIWEEVMKNVTNSTIGMLLESTTEAIDSYKCIIFFITFILQTYHTTLNNIDSIALRRVPRKIYIFFIGFLIFLLLLLCYLIYQMDRFNIFELKICKMILFSENINDNISFILSLTNNSPPKLYTTYICMLCTIILSSIQHVIMLIVIFKIKPKYFKFSKDYNINENSSTQHV